MSMESNQIFLDFDRTFVYLDGKFGTCSLIQNLQNSKKSLNLKIFAKILESIANTCSTVQKTELQKILNK